MNVPIRRRAVIIEGADGNGKSYLAERLERDLVLKRLVCGPAPDTKRKIKNWLKVQHQQCINGNVILDRITCLSSLAYYEVCDRPISENSLREACRRLVSLANPVVIHCDTEVPTIEPKDHKTDGYIERMYRSNNVISARYRDILLEFGFDTLNYDWRKDSYSLLLRDVKYAIYTSSSV